MGLVQERDLIDTSSLVLTIPTFGATVDTGGVGVCGPIGWTEHGTGTVLPLGDVAFHLLQLLLEPLAKDVHVVVCAVPDTPAEHEQEKGRTGPPVPEPDGAGDDGEQGIAVLDEHEGRFLQCGWERNDNLADPRRRV